MTQRIFAFASELSYLSPANQSRVTHILLDDGSASSRASLLHQFHDFEAKSDDDGDRDSTAETERGFLI
jgi:hypothetical protein